MEKLQGEFKKKHARSEDKMKLSELLKTILKISELSKLKLNTTNFENTMGTIK